MKKLLFLLISVLILALAACAAPSEPTYDTIPTPPSISQEKTPFEMLSAALEQTVALEQLRLEYCRDGESFYCVGSGDEVLDTAEEWIPNPDFLADFCVLPLNAIPSNTGIIRYQVTGLTADELSALLGIEVPDSEDCTVALEVDARGYLVRFEYQAGTHQRSIALRMD